MDELLFRVTVAGKRSFLICGDRLGEGSAERGRCCSNRSSRDGRFFAAAVRLALLVPKSTTHVEAGEGHSLEFERAWNLKSSLAE